MAVVQDSDLISLLIYSAYNFSNRISLIDIQFLNIVARFRCVVKDKKQLYNINLNAMLFEMVIDKVLNDSCMVRIIITQVVFRIYIFKACAGIHFLRYGGKYNV